MAIDNQNLEKNLLEQAIEAVYKETGLEFHITHTEFAEKEFHYVNYLFQHKMFRNLKIETSSFDCSC